MEDSLQSLLLALDMRSSTSLGRSLRRLPLSTRTSLVRLTDWRRKSAEERMMHGVLIRGAGGPVNLSLRWAHVDGSRKNVARRTKARVRALQKLVPNGDTGSLDSLFREAANYIACLQLQVKIMQAMVDILSGPCE